MSESTKNNFPREGHDNTIQELEQEVAYLRSLVNAYENLSIFKEREFKDVHSTLSAYEKLQLLQSKEKVDADTTIDAFRQMTEMTAHELKESREMVSAYQHLSEYHARELEDAQTTIDAMEHASELTRGELKHFHDRINNIRCLEDPIQQEMFDILDEDDDNEQHLLMKLNLLNLRKSDQNFYSHLFNVLVNLDFEEEEAKKYWEEILELNKEVSTKLGRNISFRVSMLDYFIDLNKHIKNPKIIEFKFFESALTDAIFDRLTGLLNRTHLSIAARGSIRNARNSNTRVGVIMFDLDNFKRFNDFFGHQEGDSLLKSFGQILAKAFIGNNTVFRYGGEEFVAIVETDDEEYVKKLADTVRSQLSREWKNCILPVSVSGGYAMYPADGDTVDELISKADNALYEAKFSGKNMILRFSLNRRKNSRLFASKQVLITIDGNDTAFTAKTMDVGKGGFALESSQPLSKGDCITIQLEGDADSEPPQLKAVVCWIQEKEGDAGPNYIFGVEFNDSTQSSTLFKHCF